MPDVDRREDVLTESKVEQRLERPRLWRVLLHNDDFTTQEFVVWVLETVFHRASADAFSIMMHVHQSGVGIAGIYTREVAETKIQATRRLAEQNEYPLLVTMEPEVEVSRT